MLFDRLVNCTEPVWEFEFDTYALQPSYQCGKDHEEQRNNWQQAFASIAGDDAVLTGDGSVDQLERKGYKPIVAPENLVNAAVTSHRPAKTSAAGHAAPISTPI